MTFLIAFLAVSSEIGYCIPLNLSSSKCLCCPKASDHSKILINHYLLVYLRHSSKIAGIFEKPKAKASMPRIPSNKYNQSIYLTIYYGAKGKPNLSNTVTKRTNNNGLRPKINEQIFQKLRSFF